jgi:subtilisin family serine protease
VPGHAMVRIAEGSSLQSFMTAFKEQFPSATVIDSIQIVDTHLLQFPAAQGPAVEQALANTYVSQGFLTWGELSYEGQTPEGKTGSTWVDGPVAFAEYTGQYAGDLIDIEGAHKRSTGAGIVIAVLDTGVDSMHPQLQGRVLASGFNFITNTSVTLEIPDTLDSDNDGDANEMLGHGTYVAGLITLVAPDANILPVTVLNTDGIGDGWLFAKGLHYAIDHGVEVINLSLGSTYNAIAVEEALVRARDLGIVVVSAAGNFDRDDPREFPAMTQLDNVPDEMVNFGVAATDHNDVKADFSNFSDRLFISAPGNTAGSGGLPNINLSMISTLPGGEWGLWEGTSMCVPLVSGSVALIRAQHPEWPATYATFAAIRQVLTQTAENIDPQNPNYDEGDLGVGRINTGAAVDLGPTAPQLGDLNNDGLVGIDDLFQIIADWGQIHTPADVDGSGLVDIDDLFLVLSQW